MAASGDKTRRGELTDKINIAKGIRADRNKFRDEMNEISD